MARVGIIARRDTMRSYDLVKIAKKYDLSLSQLGLFYGYRRKHFYDMVNNPGDRKMTPQLYNSIEAHLMLSKEQIEKLKKLRLKKRSTSS